MSVISHAHRMSKISTLISRYVISPMNAKGQRILYVLTIIILELYKETRILIRINPCFIPTNFISAYLFIYSFILSFILSRCVFLMGNKSIFMGEIRRIVYRKIVKLQRVYQFYNPVFKFCDHRKKDPYQTVGHRIHASSAESLIKYLRFFLTFSHKSILFIMKICFGLLIIWILCRSNLEQQKLLY